VNQLRADVPITANQARQLAAAFTAAVNEFDEMTGHEQIVVSYFSHPDRPVTG
jgi:hypothetical protein